MNYSSLYPATAAPIDTAGGTNTIADAATDTAAAAVAYVFSFRHRPLHQSSTSITVCTSTAVIRAEVTLSVVSPAALLEQWAVLTPIVLGMHRPAEDIAWEQRRLDRLESMIQKLIAELSVLLVSDAHPIPAPVPIPTALPAVVPVAVSIPTTVPTVPAVPPPTAMPVPPSSPRHRIVTETRIQDAVVSTAASPPPRMGSPPPGVSKATMDLVLSIVKKRDSCPALAMNTFAAAKKLRNYINNITSATLSPDALDTICKWLVANSAIVQRPI